MPDGKGGGGLDKTPAVVAVRRMRDSPVFPAPRQGDTRCVSLSIWLYRLMTVYVVSAKVPANRERPARRATQEALRTATERIEVYGKRRRRSLFTSPETIDGQ